MRDSLAIASYVTFGLVTIIMVAVALLIGLQSRSHERATVRPDPRRRHAYLDDPDGPRGNDLLVGTPLGR